MRVYERFKSATVADLPPSVLYSLAAPSTPEPVFEEVVERVAAGERVTRDDVKALKEKWAQERKSLKEKIDEAKAKAKDAAATRADAMQQVDDLRSEIGRLRTERDDMKALTLEANEAVVEVRLDPDYVALSWAWEQASPASRARFLDALRDEAAGRPSP